MAKTAHYYAKFEPACFYHVYNRAVDRGDLFANAENRRFFLQQYDQYLSDVVDTYSYALMGNHFHFGIKIRPQTELTVFRNLAGLHQQRYDHPHALVAHQFQRFFQSYAMSFNAQQKRVGTLMQRPFKRCCVDPDDLPRLILYHHLNPVKHRFTHDHNLYEWTSYGRYLGQKPSKLPRQAVWDIFGGRDKFIEYHRVAKEDIWSERDWVIEDV